MKGLYMKKKEIIKIANDACNELEQGNENTFFELLENILTLKITFSKMAPFAEIVGKRGLNKPEFYFNVIDKLANKSIDYGYKAGLYNTEKLKMSEEEVQKSRVYGYRAGIIGIIFNEMSIINPELVIERTKEYIIKYNHWSASDTFADKTFHNLFKNNFDFIFDVLKEWAINENKWIRNTAGFAVHAPVEKKIITKELFVKSLEILDLLMKDKDKDVKSKVGWALRTVTKYYPDETYFFLKKWAAVKDKNTHWIIKNGMKFIEDNRKRELNNILTSNLY